MTPTKRRILLEHRRAHTRRPFFKAEAVYDPSRAAFWVWGWIKGTTLLVPMLSEGPSLSPAVREKVRRAFRRGFRQQHRGRCRKLRGEAAPPPEGTATGPRTAGEGGSGGPSEA